MPRRVFITVAEVSGDKHAAQLARALQTIDPGIILEGLGGPEMAAAGVKIHHETVGEAAMMHHALGRVLDVLRLLRWTRRYFEANPPDLQICVDSPAMNFHFAKLGKRFRVPVMYYIAPQLWAWREGRMKKLRRWVDRVACILPFEEEYFNRHNVRATFVGHPLFDELPAHRHDSRGLRFPDRPPVIGLLAGSRLSEAKANFPHQLDVAARVAGEFPEATFLVPTTPATHPVVRWVLDRAPHGLRARISAGENQFDQMVCRCDLCITVSGTATLHLAGHGVPMIVVYRGNRLLWHLAGRWIIRTRTYSLVNLLSDVRRHIVPEFVPWYGSNAPVAEYALDMLKHPAKLETQRRELRKLVHTLDQPGASLNAARLAMSMIVSDQTTVVRTP